MAETVPFLYRSVRFKLISFRSSFRSGPVRTVPYNRYAKTVQGYPTVVRRHGKTNKSNPRNVRAGYGTRELPVSGPKSRSSSKGGDKGSVQGLSRHSRVSASRTWDPGQHLVRLSDCEMTGGVSNETNVKSLSPSRIILNRKRRRPEQTK